MRSLVLIFVSVIALAGCSGAHADTATAVPVKVATVTSSQIPAGLTLTGMLKPAKEIDLSSKTSGKLVLLTVDTGSRIHTGDLIARIDTDTSSVQSAAVTGQSSALDHSLSSLRALYDEKAQNIERDIERTKTTFDAEIAVQKTRISESQNTAHTNADTTGDSAIEIAQTQLSSFQNNLAVATHNALSTAETTLGTAQDTMDSILGVTPQYQKNNADFKIYLGSLDANAKPHAEDAFKAFLQARQSDTGTDVAPAIAALNASLNALNSTYTLLLKTQPVAAFPQSTLDTYKTNIINLTTQIQTMIQNMQLIAQGTLNTPQGAENLNVLQKQLADAISHKKTAVTTVDSDVSVAQKQLDSLAAQEAAELARLQDSLTLTSREEDTKERDLLSQKETLTGQQAVIGTALSDGSVYAPFDGVITDKLQEVGSIVGGGAPIVHLAKTTAMKLTLSIPDSAAASFGMGKEAEVMVDGLSGRTFMGSITRILPEADTNSKKLLVEITIDNGDNTLKIGMFARAAFALSANKGLVIPMSAVQNRYGTTSVFVVQDGKAEECDIVLGRTEGDSALVTSGLTEGEQVITSGVRFLTSGTPVTPQP